VEFNINVHIYCHGDSDSSARLDRIDSTLKEIKRDMALSVQEIKAAILAGNADIKQHVTDSGARVTTTVNALTQKIADLEAKVGETLTQADLDEIKAAQSDVIAAADSVDPNTPAPTPIA
jgi:hypothetical protein